MTLFEATYLMKREYNGARMSDPDLDDAVVAFQDALEDVQSMKRSRSHHYDIACTACPEGLSYEPAEAVHCS